MKIIINSNKLKGILVSKGIEIKALAKEMNLTSETVSRKINNKCSISLADAIFISKLLNMSVEDIFEVTEIIDKETVN